MDWRLGRLVMGRAAFGVLWVLLWGGVLFAQEEFYAVRVEPKGAAGLRVVVEVKGYTARAVQNASGAARTSFRVVGAPNTMERGSPSLPYVVATLPLPCDGVEAWVVEADYEALPESPPLPSRGSVIAGSAASRAPLVEGEAYGDTAMWPRGLLELRPWGGGEGGTRLLVYPFRYCPGEGRVFLARRMVIEVALRRGLRLPSGAVGGAGVGLQGLGTRGARGGRGRLLVIYAKEFEGGVGEFLHFKRMAGLAVESVSFDAGGGGDLQDTAAIRQYIKRSYESHADLRYVLFIGSFTKVPSRAYAGITRKTVSDWLYSPVSPRYRGGQVAFGRLPAETRAELRRMLEKTMRYERGDARPGGGWQGRALGLASGDPDYGYGGRTDAQHVAYVGKLLQEGGYTAVTNLFDNANGVAVNAAAVVGAVHGGVGLINYLGHGLSDRWRTSGMTTADAIGLKNRGEWPFVISTACDNGLRSAAGAPSFAEGWLLAHDEGEPTGAIAFTGASDEILWEEPMLAQEQMNLRLLGQGAPGNPLLTVGDIFTYGLVRMVEAYGDSLVLLQSADVWHLFGDPSLPLRTREPLATQSLQPDVLVAGMREMPVHCAGEGGVVTFCRRRDGAAPLYVSAVSQGDRVVLAGLEVQAGDEVALAISHANRTMVWREGMRVQAQQELQLLVYPYLKIRDTDPQGYLTEGSRLELEVEVVNVSNASFFSPIPLYIATEPYGALELLEQQSSPRLLPPLRAGEALAEPLRFYFRAGKLRDLSGVRVRLFSDGVSARRVLVDERVAYRLKPYDTLGQAARTLRIAPNPTTGVTNLRVGVGMERVRVFTLLGSCVLDKRVGGQSEVRLDLSGLANGIYLAVVEGGDLWLCEKLVLNR